MRSFVDDDAERIHPQAQEDDQDHAERNRPGQGEAREQVRSAKEDCYFHPEHAPIAANVTASDGKDRAPSSSALTS